MRRFSLRMSSAASIPKSVKLSGTTVRSKQKKFLSTRILEARRSRSGRFNGNETEVCLVLKKIGNSPKNFLSSRSNIPTEYHGPLVVQNLKTNAQAYRSSLYSYYWCGADCHRPGM